MNITYPPIKPANGRVCVQPLPYKPSKTIEVISDDNADIFEGYVVALSPHKFARRKTKNGWEMTGQEIPHDVKVGDRVIFKPQYAQDDFVKLNGQDYRILDAWDIYCVVEADRPEGFQSVIDGSVTPEVERKIIFQ